MENDPAAALLASGRNRRGRNTWYHFNFHDSAADFFLFQVIAKTEPSHRSAWTWTHTPGPGALFSILQDVSSNRINAKSNEMMNGP